MAGVNNVVVLAQDIRKRKVNLFCLLYGFIVATSKLTDLIRCAYSRKTSD